MKKKNDYPRRLDNKLSMKEIEKCYKDEIELIEYKAKWRKSPYKVPWYPWAYYCTYVTDYTLLQWII